MTFRAVFLSLICAASLAASPAAVAGQETLSLSAATHKPVKHPRAERREAEGQIACTVFGCHRIPPNCHPATGYYWNGMPTGFDIIVCR
jgi:hypothetical protein